MFLKTPEKPVSASLRRELTRNGDFDESWYVRTYQNQDKDPRPLAHFLREGWLLGHFPNPVFDPSWYLSQNPDVAASGMNPLIHYVKHGASEGRHPHAWFDAGYYASRVGLAKGDLTPVAHYLAQPPHGRVAPSPRVEAYLGDRAGGAPSTGDAFLDLLHDPRTQLQGHVGDCTTTFVNGWACRAEGPSVLLDIRVNGATQATIEPWLVRHDVAAHGFALKSGFFHAFQRPLATGDIVEVVDERGAHLNGSPHRYEVPPLSPDVGFLRQRAAIAEIFLKGRGLEIGAFTQPTDLPAHAVAEFYDRFPYEELRKHYDESWGRPLFAPAYWGDAQALSGIPGDARFDFVIANHVIEHLEDPIRFLKRLADVLNVGGHAMLTAPNKKFTFDFRRQLTPFEHIDRDHREGPQSSRKSHYREWAELVECKAGGEAVALADKLDRENFSIHFHVWDESAFYQFLIEASEKYQLPLTAMFVFSANHETVVVLRRLPLPAAV